MESGLARMGETNRASLGRDDTIIFRYINLSFIVLGVTFLSAVILLTVTLATDLGDTITRNTIRLSLAWYTAAILLMLNHKERDWSATTSLGNVARWCWTWALLTYLVHVALAFHYFHHWSHADAFERTRQVSGTGEGIYVSYFFTLLWTADVAWWWFRPKSYAHRPAFIGRVLHGFMLFIIFNATIIYETGPIRWIGLAAFAAFIVMWLKMRRGWGANG